MERWLTSEQVEEVTGFSRVKVWRLRKEGKLRSAKVGNSRRFSENDVTAMMEAARQEVASPLPSGTEAA